VWSQFGREIAVLDLRAEQEKRAGRAGPARPIAGIPISIGSPLPEAQALGRRLFHAAGDPRISADGRACASCHPDGRDDGLVWKTPFGRLQTPMLAGRIEGTAPYGWKQDGETVKEHLAQTFKRLGGKGLPEAELDALIAYVVALPTPPRGEPQASAAVERGREIFASMDAMCSICHVEAKAFADGSLHDVSSGGPLDTPSLRFLSGTAPYFHDGRFATIRELLLATDGKMGNVRHLGEEDLGALEAYLMSL
jgi:cytochrome c peroxidase